MSSKLPECECSRIAFRQFLFPLAMPARGCPSRCDVMCSFLFPPMQWWESRPVQWQSNARRFIRNGRHRCASHPFLEPTLLFGRTCLFLGSRFQRSLVAHKRRVPPLAKVLGFAPGAFRLGSFLRFFPIKNRGNMIFSMFFSKKVAQPLAVLK